MREREPGREQPGREKTNVRWLGRTYQGALEAVLALVIMVVLGAWADSRFDTKPFLFLLGLAIGFGSFVLRLVRLLGEQTPRPNGQEDPAERRE